MVVNVEFYAPAAVLPEKSRGTHGIGRWVGPRTGLDVTEKKKVSFPCRHSTHGPSSPIHIVAVPTTLSRFPKIVVIYPDDDDHHHGVGDDGMLYFIFLDRRPEFDKYRLAVIHLQSLTKKLHSQVLVAQLYVRVPNTNVCCIQ